MLNEGLRKPLPIPPGVPLFLRDIVHQRTGIYFEEDHCDQLLEKLEPLACRIETVRPSSITTIC